MSCWATSTLTHKGQRVRAIIAQVRVILCADVTNTDTRVQRSATVCIKYKYSEPHHTKSRTVVTTLLVAITQLYDSAL